MARVRSSSAVATVRAKQFLEIVLGLELRPGQFLGIVLGLELRPGQFLGIILGLEKARAVPRDSARGQESSQVYG